MFSILAGESGLQDRPLIFDNLQTRLRPADESARLVGEGVAWRNDRFELSFDPAQLI
jgi:hypothetical protein